MYNISILTICLLIHGAICSRVVDVNTQIALNQTDYCPRIGQCGEGSHVMCLYNPTRVMGPACYDFLTNMTITPEYADLILNIINRIRSSIANGGHVRAMNGQYLPKGYGMFKVVWDEELATFAQVWANQCILRQDLCRSSKRFPNVGQALGMTRLTVSDWMPLHKKDFNETFLTPAKVKYSIKSIMKAWWNMKNIITPEDVKTFNQSSGAQLRNTFLNLVHGPLTHMGCGISVYKEYAYKDNLAALIFNCIQIVCNFSTRPKVGEPVYTLEAPTAPGYTARCGCPVGFDEDDACLCSESGRKPPYTCKDKDQCKPPVVVLPIFTVEDAPMPKNGFILQHIPINNNYNDIFVNLEAVDHKIDLRRRIPSNVKRRYFNTISKMSLLHNTTNEPMDSFTYASKKQSLFSRAGIFELPIKKRKQAAMSNVKEFKKDVAPRKDFTKVQQLVSSYLDKKKHGKPFDSVFNKVHSFHGPISYNDYYHNRTLNQQIKENIKDFIENAKKKVTDTNNLNITKDEFRHTNITLNIESDTKLMTLLDKLEAEMKNIDLNTNEKGIFDEKIRKIYGTLVGKPGMNLQKFQVLSRDSINETINDFKSNEMSEISPIQENYGLNTNKLKNNFYKNIENNYNSLANYENKFDRAYRNNFYYSNLKEQSENVGKRKFRNIYDVRENFKGNQENLRSRTEFDEYYPLDSERRRYYHKKLTNLQKKLNDIKRNGHPKKVPEDRHIRPVRPTKHEKPKHRRPPNDHINTYYMPDRARFLHGF